MSDDQHRCGCSCLGCKRAHIHDVLTSRDECVDLMLLALDRIAQFAAHARGLPACNGITDTKADCVLGEVHTQTATLARRFVDAMIDPANGEPASDLMFRHLGVVLEPAPGEDPPLVH